MEHSVLMLKKLTRVRTIRVWSWSGRRQQRSNSRHLEQGGDLVAEIHSPAAMSRQERGWSRREATTSELELPGCSCMALVLDHLRDCRLMAALLRSTGERQSVKSGADGRGMSSMVIEPSAYSAGGRLR
jgi:hypothetical protein